MNKFSKFGKLGRNSNTKFYTKSFLKMNNLFEVLMQNKYTADDLQFHFEIRIDTDDTKWGDPEGVSNIKYFKKKNLIASSITLIDNKCVTEGKTVEFLYDYMFDALGKMIQKLQKEKVEINSEKLLEDFKTNYKEIMGNISD